MDDFCNNEARKENKVAGQRKKKLLGGPSQTLVIRRIQRETVKRRLERRLSG